MSSNHQAVFLQIDRPNMGGPAANLLGADGMLHDVIYRKAYILHGDLDHGEGRVRPVMT